MLTENEKLHGKWFIMHQKIDLFDAKNIKINDPKCVNAPSGYFYADPVCVKEKGLYYVFFELFDYIKGKLAYYTLDKELNHSEIELLDIDISPHASYPYIFKDNDTYYMIPETCHLNSINLYECVSFPNKWILKKVLINNVHAADNSIIKIEDTYYLFTMIFDGKRYYFCIYYSLDLFGEWREHKLVNSNYLNIKNEHVTRGAGKIFINNDKIIRPAQYSNKGINGEGVILYQIKNITPTSYQEIPLNIVSKRDLNSVRAIHTFSLCGDLISLDGRLERKGDNDYTPVNIENELKKIQDTNYYVDHEILEKAFSLNTSGNGLCYYGIKTQNKSYCGERDWDKRWKLLKDCVDFKDKNVLEIGCNMGIMLTYLKKFRNINRAVGVDEPDEMLISSNKKDTIKAAILLDKGFCVNNIDYIQINLNTEEYEVKLAHNFDIVVAMSILKWIDDKERFLNYLSCFNNIIYEGHDSDEIEISRFTKYGYNYKILGKTQTGASYSQDDMRTMILFYK